MGIFINGREITSDDDNESLNADGMTVSGSIVGGDHYGVSGGTHHGDLVFGDDQK